MEQILMDTLLDGTVSITVALVFFWTFFQDRKENKEYKTKQMEHEKALAVILADVSRVIEDNQCAFTDTLEILKDDKKTHNDMDLAIERIETKLDELITSEALNTSNQLDTIKTVNSIRDMILQLKTDRGSGSLY